MVTGGDMKIPLLSPGMKKVLPFWIAAMIVAILGILILYKKNVRLINYIQYPETNPLLLAEAYRLEGEKYYKKASGKFALMKQNPNRKEKMKNLPELERARRLFLLFVKTALTSKEEKKKNNQ